MATIKKNYNLSKTTTLPDEFYKVYRYNTPSGEVTITLADIKKYLVHGNADKVTDQELMMFLQLCRYQGLNPWLREAYLIKYGDKATIVVGKETFTKRASQIPQCNGWKAGVILKKQDEIIYREGTFYLDGVEEIVGGWAEVYRKDWKVPIRSEVAFNEYMGTTRDENGNVVPNKQWREKPATMIRKVALVQALREAFPKEFGGMYDSSEMGVEIEENQTNKQKRYIQYLIETIKQMEDKKAKKELENTLKEYDIDSLTKEQAKELIDRLISIKDEFYNRKLEEKEKEAGYSKASENQLRAIKLMKQKVDEEEFKKMLSEYGVEKEEDLTVEQAGEVILKLNEI